MFSLVFRSPIYDCILAIDGSTPLHMAARNGHTSVFGSLIGRGAEVDAATHNASTALHFAAGNGHIEFVRLLLQQGANINARSTFLPFKSTRQISDGSRIPDNESMTPLQLAKAMGHSDIVRIMEASQDARQAAAYQRSE
ncbi:ankyrin repeat-containing domain protein [Mycena capillaripes]|nr:ankyrin repeat-containing domain protein [Mycena capillaripes]